MARQLNVTCNFNTGYLICDILENTVEIVVKIKIMFGKHTLVDDQDRKIIKYRPCRRQNQPKIRMEMKKRVVPLKIRRMKKEGTVLGTTWDSGAWSPEEEGFGYPPRSSQVLISYRPTKKKEWRKHTLMTRPTIMPPLMIMIVLMNPCHSQ